MKTTDIEKLLAEAPVPPVPEDLADRIKNEIPAELGAPSSASANVVPLHRRWAWQLAAAATLMLALTGSVTWELMQQPRVPLRDMALTSDTPTLAEGTSPQVEAPAADPADATGTTTATPAPVGSADRLRTDHLQETDRSEETRARIASPAPGIPEVRNEAPVPGRGGTQRPRVETTAAQQTEETSRPGRPQAPPSGDAPVPDPTPKRSFTGEINVTSSYPLTRTTSTSASRPISPAPAEQPTSRWRTAPPSTGGTTEPNDAPYGDVFFAEHGTNPFIDTDDDALSTFGLDVDTGSYTVLRRYLRDGHLPPREAVRIEEVVNALDYGDQPPRRKDFRLTAEAAPTPFGESDRYAVVRFGIRAREVDTSQRPPAHLTFVVDVSGSMAQENRLGLVKRALLELLDHLRDDDHVALVVFGTSGQVLLEPTEDHGQIRAAIDSLAPSGSTNAEEGLEFGYQLAAKQLNEKGLHRVILCSDGVANVGRTGPDSILGQIERYAEQGIELTTVGFGMGNYNDELMERLADTGDGRYAYVDTFAEARRLFVSELTGTLMTIARDAKAQVEFNPRTVSRYRLLGYENRDIADEQFRDPAVDAGEIGAGHSVTVLYEIKLRSDAPRRGTLATLRVRYRPAEGNRKPVELKQRLNLRNLAPSWGDASASLRLASLVAEYAELLKGSYWARRGSMRDVLRRAQQLAPSFAGDTRVADWISLVATAAELRGDDQPETSDDERQGPAQQ